MEYQKITEGRFLNRPNRFIAFVEIDGKTERVHVKNTGRCQELLTPNAKVFLAESENPGRSTRYDLVAVQKGSSLINMDSQAPNKAVAEWLKKKILFPDLQTLKSEFPYGNSRLDFYVEAGPENEIEKILIEVKGVTLEKDNVVYFPDAPSERAVRHVKELTEAVKKGFQAYILLVVQMQDVLCFKPNAETHPEFAKALLEARDAGVQVLAYDCIVTPGSMEIRAEVPVKLSVLDEIALPILKWYDTERRILPWREDPKPYRVWVSEIMLQQTRVEAVKPYYERFMKALPDISSLAGASEEVLLKLWEGLGYYSRVRNLQKAARQVMEDYHGVMPSTNEELMKLAGIGSYTAGAISSIAFGQRTPAVDGNVLRVLARLRTDSSDITRPEVKRRIEMELQAVIPSDRPGDFNQAMMELGAMICTPNGVPKCKSCPLEALCMAHLTARQEDFPVKAAKKIRKQEEKTILILRKDDKVALKKRPAKGLLAGMYEFPALSGHLSAEEVLRKLKKMGVEAVYIKKLSPSKHIFTHKEWHMNGYLVKVDELTEGKSAEEGMFFVEKADIQERYPIPSAYAAYAEYLNIKLGIDNINRKRI